MTPTDTARVLKEIYYDPSSSGGLGGVHRLSRAVKAAGHAIPLKAIKEWLRGEETYTLFKPAIRRFIRNKVRVAGPRDTLSSDLIDLSSLSAFNDDYNWLLTVIDVFTKEAEVIPLKRKDALTVSVGIRQALDKFGHVNYFWSDCGGEYKNSRLQKLFRDRGIKQYNTNNETIKACVSERFVRTLRERIFKYLHANNTKRYIDALPQIVSAYNNSYHRSIKMAPKQVSELNKGDVFINLYGAGLKKDDPVRMTRKKGTFEKGSEPNWTQEIFFVTDKVTKHPIHTYKVRDYNKDPVIGTFYKQELQHVTPPETYKIERIIRTRRRGGRTEYLVKWLGYPESFASWETDLVDL